MSRAGRFLISVVTFAALAGAWACPVTQTAPPEPDPVGVLEAWHGALVSGRPDAAYALLGPELKDGLSLTAFRTLYTRQRAALVAQAKALLDHASKVPADQRAVVQIGPTAARLVRTRQGWRLLEPVAGKTSAPPTREQ